MQDIPWNKIAIEEFISLACLTEEETEVLRQWAAGWSIVKIAMHHGMSTRTVDRIIKRLRDKYDEVEIYTPLLPSRKK